MTEPGSPMTRTLRARRMRMTALFQRLAHLRMWSLVLRFDGVTQTTPGAKSPSGTGSILSFERMS